jgi:glycosyltransferase involved in cell wall biosynthesis
VVATKIPGCIDAVSDGVTGTLVPPYDVPELCTALRNYLRSPQLREAHGTLGRKRVLQEFSQEQMWDALRKEYVELLDEHGLQRPADKD